VTNASAKKRELFYQAVDSLTSQFVVVFELKGADALADFPANPAPLNAVTDNILHHCPSGPAMFWLGVAVRS
jgi:hypothetical protein